MIAIMETVYISMRYAVHMKTNYRKTYFAECYILSESSVSCNLSCKLTTAAAIQNLDFFVKRDHTNPSLCV